MNTLTHNGYSARIAFDEEDEIFVGHIAGIRDIVGFHADTVSGLKQAFRDAVDDYLETCARAGKTPQKPFSGRVMFRIDPAIHHKAVVAAELSGKSLNQWAEDALARAAQDEVG